MVQWEAQTYRALDKIFQFSNVSKQLFKTTRPKHLCWPNKTRLQLRYNPSWNLWPKCMRLLKIRKSITDHSVAPWEIYNTSLLKTFQYFFWSGIHFLKFCFIFPLGEVWQQRKGCIPLSFQSRRSLLCGKYSILFNETVLIHPVRTSGLRTKTLQAKFRRSQKLCP